MRSATTATATSVANDATILIKTKQVLTFKLRAALWGFFSGDALASPTHWYYGGRQQIQDDYGTMGITNYTKPKIHLRDSKMNKSNINGDGRSTMSGFSKSSSHSIEMPSIVGDIINHGKRDYWAPNKSIHYHTTLAAGENTLEAQLARVLMKSIANNDGEFNSDLFRNQYVKFMMTPRSHNDTYASTCHRMFFANLIYKELPPSECPDKNNQNVETIDGLVLPTIVSMAEAAKIISSTSSSCSDARTNNLLDDMETSAAQCASVTRSSTQLQLASKIWSRLVYSSLIPLRRWNNEDDDEYCQFSDCLDSCANSLHMRRSPNPNVQPENTMSTCHLSQSIPPLFDMVAKYTLFQQQQKKYKQEKEQQQCVRNNGNGSNYHNNNVIVWEALLDNANAGGENVHRGSILGAILGAREYDGSSNNNGEKKDDEEIRRISDTLKYGLYDMDELEDEINHFIKSVVK